MEWAHAYYTRQSETFGRAVITETNRRIAVLLDQWATELNARTAMLELGAGAGGLASALADLGRDVVAIEFNPSDAAFARTLAAESRPGRVTVVEDDFYTTDLNATFDFIYYWDGFGIGTDDDQRRLLRRIAHEWLTPDGHALLDVFSPWNWARRDGETSNHTARDGSKWTRRVRYDAIGNRLMDTWCPHDEMTARTQTIRCYGIPDLVMLLEGTGLTLERVLAETGEDVDPTRASTSHARTLLDTNGYFALVRRDAASP